MKVVYVVRVVAEDWQGTYINGKLFLEGHHIHLGLLLNKLEGKLIAKVDTYSIIEDVLENVYGGIFPSNLLDLKDEHLELLN